MRTHLTALALAALIGTAAQPAAAQNAPRTNPIRFELGANVTTFGYGSSLGGPQFAVNFLPRHAVQVAADIAAGGGEYGWNTEVLYTIQYRYALPVSTEKTQVFVTGGVLGFLGWSHTDGYTYTEPAYNLYGPGGQTIGTVPERTYSRPAYTSFNSQPPILPMGGIGVQRFLGSRIAVRGDVSLVVGDEEAALRASVGVVIPLGRVKR
jgi:hypothetical protein